MTPQEPHRRLPVPIKVELAAVVLSPAQRHALADLDTGTDAVALVQNTDRADVVAQAADGRRWRVEADGNVHVVEPEADVDA